MNKLKSIFILSVLLTTMWGCNDNILYSNPENGNGEELAVEFNFEWPGDVASRSFDDIPPKTKFTNNDVIHVIGTFHTKALNENNTYTWDTYKFGSSPSKYNDTDGKTELELEDDAAYVNWVTSCRLPPDAELDETTGFLSKTTNDDLTKEQSPYGVAGTLFTASNGNTLFLPSAGFRFGQLLGFTDMFGNYWSSTLNSQTLGRGLHFLNASTLPLVENYERYNGFSVRAIRRF